MKNKKNYCLFIKIGLIILCLIFITNNNLKKDENKNEELPIDEFIEHVEIVEDRLDNSEEEEIEDDGFGTTWGHLKIEGSKKLGYLPKWEEHSFKEFKDSLDKILSDKKFLICNNNKIINSKWLNSLYHESVKQKLYLPSLSNICYHGDYLLMQTENAYMAPGFIFKYSIKTNKIEKINISKLRGGHTEFGNVMLNTLEFTNGDGDAGCWFDLNFEYSFESNEIVLIAEDSGCAGPF